MRTRLSFCAALSAGLVLWMSPLAKSASKVLKVRADIQGAAGSGITGEAKLMEHDDGILPGVHIVIHVRGLEPNTEHGLHIHEVGACVAPFTSAGGHFDPGPNGNSNPDGNHPFHMGDLTNLQANSAGHATLEYHTSRITLSPGPLSIFDGNGSAFIVHAFKDQGINGAPGSGVAGGARIACGIIVPE